jgi:hypothetical protein
MREFVCYMVDETADQRDRLTLTTEEVEDARRRARSSPITPLIVALIERKTLEKGFSITSPLATLYGIAKSILLGKRKGSAIQGHFEAVQPTASPPPAQGSGRQPLHLIQYSNPIEEIETLTDRIRSRERIPVVWCKSRGLMVHHNSRHYPLFENGQQSELNNPEEMIRFIISKPQEKVVYIFEDFHHFLGDKAAVNPVVGAIRSLVKDLHRSLLEREESVYLFVPEPYELPPELQPFFTPNRHATRPAQPFLDRYGQLLTDDAYLSKIKPVIGISHLIERVIQILAQLETNNPLLVGYPGVGKTAVVEGFARELQEGRVAANLKDKALYALSLNSLVAGTRYRGDFEARLEGLMKEVMENREHIIIFIDEIQVLLDAGSAEGSVGAGEILKPLLARSEFPCIGATTHEGADRLGRDPALVRRFKKIIVREPTAEEAVKILRGVAGAFERHHRVTITDEALEAAVRISIEQITDQYLPGKAIALIDGTAAFCGIRGRQTIKASDVMQEIARVREIGPQGAT